jgi:hypothetical protein
MASGCDVGGMAVVSFKTCSNRFGEPQSYTAAATWLLRHESEPLKKEHSFSGPEPYQRSAVTQSVTQAEETPPMRRK